MKILVVVVVDDDDDRAVREALRRALTLGGYEVQLADGGVQALELLAESLPDVVVLDVAMPDVDGLEVCRRLRRIGNRVPVLILTARDAVADRIDGLDVGADDYMAKPFDVGELKARLRALLRRAAPAEDASRQLAFAELRLDPARHGAVVAASAEESGMGAGHETGGAVVIDVCVIGEHAAGLEVAVGPAEQQLGVLDLLRTRREHDPRRGLGAPLCPAPLPAVRRARRP